MSRGLGKTQRAILDALQASPAGFLEVTDLAARVYHANIYPADELADRDHDEYRRLYFFAHEAITRAEYVATFRAVQQLERRGLVETKVHIPKRVLGLYGGPPWKSVRLVSVDAVDSGSTLTRQEPPA